MEIIAHEGYFSIQLPNMGQIEESVEYQMIEQRTENGLIWMMPVSIGKTGDLEELRYIKVGMGQSIREAIKVMGLSDICEFCKQLCRSLKECENYLLLPERVVLDWNYIFYDIKERQITLMYCPIAHEYNNLYNLIRAIAQNLHQMNRREVKPFLDAVSNILAYEDCNPENLEQVVSNILGTVQKSSFSNLENQSRADCEEVLLYQGYEQIGVQEIAIPPLNQSILIGRTAKDFHVDVAFSPECREIGRIHAKLENTADGIIITDMNSKNGLYVNGTQLTENCPHILFENDEVWFANKKYAYIFKKKEKTL